MPSRDTLFLHLDTSKACELIPFAVEAMEDRLLTFEEAIGLLTEQVRLMADAEEEEEEEEEEEIEDEAFEGPDWDDEDGVEDDTEDDEGEDYGGF